VVTALSLGCVGASLLMVLSLPPGQAVVAHWRVESTVLLGILTGETITVFFSRRRLATFILLFLRSIVVAIVTVPFGDLMAVKLLLWSSLVLESGGFLDPPASLLVQGGVLLAVSLSHRAVSIWGDELLQGRAAAELVAAGACLAGLGVLVHFFRASASILRERKRQFARLDEAVRQLTVANLSFQKLASSAEERSAEDERKRITREIHDAIGYALTNLIMMMEAAIRLSPEHAAGLRTLLGQARDEAQVGLNETRRALRVLRTVSPERVLGLAAIHHLVTLFSSATGVDVKADYCNADLSYGETMDLVIYRMVQEGMTNAFRHGHATHIRLVFWQEPGGVRVKVWDNGAAAESITEGLGLSGMRERIERIGGTLRAVRVLDGFELMAWLPLPARDAAPHGRGERVDTGGEDNASTR
jgi:signal transduction histidine kinase